MQILLDIIEILSLIAKIIIMIYAGYKFFTGDSDKNSTLYYGILFIATLVRGVDNEFCRICREIKSNSIN